MPTPTNAEALEAHLASLDGAALSAPLVALARTLAATLDAGAGLSTAAVSREYRATLEAITDGARRTDDADDLLAALRDAP